MSGIKYIIGDATLPSTRHPDRSVIVHCCNNIGGWGSGFVVPLGRRYPTARQAYLAWHQELGGKLVLGTVQVIPVAPDISVANLIGQDGVRGPGVEAPIRYGAIREGLDRLARYAASYEDTFDPQARVGQTMTFHMPRIGCGLAGGSWALMEPIIEEALVGKGFEVTVYDFPGGEFNP